MQQFIKTVIYLHNKLNYIYLWLYNANQPTNIEMKKNFFAAPIVVITVLGGLLIILAFTIKNNYQQNPQSHHPDYLPKTKSVSNNSGTVDNNNKNIVDGAEINTANIEYAYRKKSCSDKLIEHLGYTVSYNSDWNLPNWVAYELTAEEVSGNEERCDNFSADPEITSNAVVSSDYTRSGYDRGHMAPAADMKWSKQAMEESFYMTNICPQIHNINAGDWKDLENLARDLAVNYGSIYICCGPIVTENDTVTIGNERKIRVPSEFFKAFLRRKTDGSWCSIGFIMPNKAGNYPLLSYVVPVDSIENKINFDLFFNLPDSIENEIEANFDIRDWSLK